jgi:tetratricopeptide (TPR) repeat protein
MLRLKRWPGLVCLALALACPAVRADENAGQSLLDKATETKLSAERVADLNEVIDLCQQAIKAGLDDTNKKFADELLASTLTQRAALICLELFERPVTPNRARKLVQMALSDLEETIKLNTEQAEAQYLVGRLYAHLGQSEKALTALDAAVRLTENEPAARAKALLIRASAQTDAAKREADYDEAVKLMPRDPNTLRFRGMFHLSETKYDSALKDFEAALAIEPNDADTNEARGLALSMMEKYDEAMESFNKAIELNPDSAMAYVHRARVRSVQGDNASALTDAEKALKLQPGSIQARMLHAALLGATGNHEKALADLNVLRNALPGNTDVLLQIAMVYQAAKQPQKAVDAYGSLLEADPGNVSAYRGRGDAYLSLGDQQHAIVDYDKALEVEPNNSGVLNNLAWVLATSPQDDLRNGKRAVELGTKACDVTEYKQAHVLSTLAAAYAEAGDFETAKKWSKKAVELGPEALKGQLGKELESYENQKPWREAMPPSDEPSEEPAEKKSDNDTARAKDKTEG